MMSPARMPALAAGLSCTTSEMRTPLALLEREALGELGRQRLNGDAEPAARHLALGRQLRVDPLGHVDGNGEADADIAARAREDGAVDPDHFARHIDEGSARVARVDGGVGLQEVVEGTLADRAPLGADDAGCHRLLEAEGRADGQHPVADLHLVGVAERGRGEGSAALETQHGEIRSLVDPGQLGFVFLAVGRRRLDLASPARPRGHW